MVDPPNNTNIYLFIQYQYMPPEEGDREFILCIMNVSLPPEFSLPLRVPFSRPIGKTDGSKVQKETLF